MATRFRSPTRMSSAAAAAVKREKAKSEDDAKKRGCIDLDALVPLIKRVRHAAIAIRRARRRVARARPARRTTFGGAGGRRPRRRRRCRRRARTPRRPPARSALRLATISSAQTSRRPAAMGRGGRRLRGNALRSPDVGGSRRRRRPQNTHHLLEVEVVAATLALRSSGPPGHPAPKNTPHCPVSPEPKLLQLLRLLQRRLMILNRHRRHRRRRRVRSGGERLLDLLRAARAASHRRTSPRRQRRVPNARRPTLCPRRNRRQRRRRRRPTPGGAAPPLTNPPLPLPPPSLRPPISAIVVRRRRRRDRSTDASASRRWSNTFVSPRRTIKTRVLRCLRRRQRHRRRRRSVDAADGVLIFVRASAFRRVQSLFEAGEVLRDVPVHLLHARAEPPPNDVDTVFTSTCSGASFQRGVEHRRPTANTPRLAAAWRPASSAALHRHTSHSARA